MNETYPLAMYVRLRIPRDPNTGDYRLSKLVTGPRGGKHWESIFHTPATGGEYSGWLGAGEYKETIFSNGWATKTTFKIEKVRTYVDEQGVRKSVWQLIEEDGHAFEEEHVEDEAPADVAG